MNFNRNNLILYAVTDARYSQNEESLFFKKVEDAILGGATCIQLREKNLSENLFFKKASRLKILCAKHNVPLIINDNVSIAHKINADGVHIGQEDAKIEDAVKILGKNKIIGVSVSNLREALVAQNSGATYLGVGSIFYTHNKSDAKRVSIRTLKCICSVVGIPVVAIGGINAQNVYKLKNCKISGVAVINAIFGTADVQDATKKLKKEVLRYLYGQDTCCGN